MSFRSRLFWLVLLFLVQFLYFPINRNVTGGVILAIPWDRYVPFWPVWAIPYLLSLAWWGACFIWAFWKMASLQYRAFVISALVMMLSSYVIYIVYPTYIERPIVQGQGWTKDLMRYIYAHDRLNNAFPSGHTYTTMLITLFWWHWYPRWRWLWGSIAVIIILSTLFTGQHNLPDPVGGILWAGLSYRVGWWWTKHKVLKVIR